MATLPTITSTSAITDVYNYQNYARGSLKSAAWTPITIPTAIKSWTGSIGLFGDDLTNFYKYCAIVGTTTCDLTKYATYSGWAIGVEIDTTTTGLASGE